MKSLPDPHAPHVVIVGAGFAGLAAARELGRSGARVTVVDSHNHHLFQPLLYQVATAELAASDIAVPVRAILRRDAGTEVLMATVQRIDGDGHRLHLDRGDTLDYDYLILAAGSRHSYFGHPEWESLAPGLKTLEDAIELRRRILSGFETAERTGDPEEKVKAMTFVIVGGGPTGVELAGAVAELARMALVRDFRHVDPRAARVVLVEAGPRILPQFLPDLSAKAEKALRRRGVEVRTTAAVTAIRTDGAEVAGEFLPARTVIWAAGVAPSPLGIGLGAPVDRLGRVVVAEDLSVPGRPHTFVAGDLAASKGEDGRPLPGLAAVAMQQGRHAARNVHRLIRAEPTEKFRYRDKGRLATVGRGAGIAQIGRLRADGTPGWLLWLFVHIVYLVGFQNRIKVLIDWAWSYATCQRGARLITGDEGEVRRVLKPLRQPVAVV